MLYPTFLLDSQDTMKEIALMTEQGGTLNGGLYPRSRDRGD